MTPANRLAAAVLLRSMQPSPDLSDLVPLCEMILRKRPASPSAKYKPTLDTKRFRKRWKAADTAEIRAKVMARLGFWCELGEHGIENAFTVDLHHLLSGNSKRSTERVSNVMRACRVCHEAYHHNVAAFVPMVVRWCARHGYTLPNRKIFRGDISWMVWLAGKRTANQHPEITP